VSSPGYWNSRSYYFPGMGSSHQNIVKDNAAIRVGIVAEKKSLPGCTTPSFKYALRIEAPAGLGALAMSVRPPPVTAPDTRATLNSRLSPGTSEDR